MADVNGFKSCCAVIQNAATEALDIWYLNAILW